MNNKMILSEIDPLIIKNVEYVIITYYTITCIYYIRDKSLKCFYMSFSKYFNILKRGMI